MKGKAVMVLGTTSGAGKSWLATALCRWYARQGLKVAPFKAQNMSNNARVVPGLRGLPGEIGSAQYFQALAARTVPDVRINPVLLKPEHDTSSQVIVMGEVRNDLRAIPWRERSEALWPHARQALDELLSRHDVVVIEGAGSPAEINLHRNDFVNMRTARHAGAACLLVTDIDRGGAFAHLYGTHQLVPPPERALIRGFVLNRFRGDAALLAPGPEQLQALTGVPTVGVLPMWRGHGLPEEDGVFDDAPSLGRGPERLRVAVVAYPRLSNLDEFQPLRSAPGVRLSWARHPRDLEAVDWVILPGSKHTRADLRWLRAQGLADAVVTHARAGRGVLGVCGGLQMLGAAVCDPDGVEGEPAEAEPGLGLLDVRTTFDRRKLLQVTRATFGGSDGLSAPWSALAGVPVQGYEIHHGRTVAHASASRAVPVLHDASGHALGWAQGPVLGVYLHGLFEDAVAMRALFGQHAPVLDQVFDGLADFVDRHMNPGVLSRLLDPL
ncbi:cobyric acid synthase [Aquabacterium sp.]|uniref:cobyric acid synthase n=1 Tax=Aquabacterium sp. TaxID=1872578 RepID=UPI0035C73446